MRNLPNPESPRPVLAASAGPGKPATGRRALAAVVEETVAAGEAVTVIDLKGAHEWPSEEPVGRPVREWPARSPSAGPATQVVAQMLDVVDRKVADQVGWARQDAEERMGVPAGDMAVLEDRVYDAVLALAAALHDLALSAAEVADAEAAAAEARGQG